MREVRAGMKDDWAAGLHIAVNRRESKGKRADASRGSSIMAEATGIVHMITINFRSRWNTPLFKPLPREILRTSASRNRTTRVVDIVVTIASYAS